MGYHGGRGVWIWEARTNTEMPARPHSNRQMPASQPPVVGKTL